MRLAVASLLLASCAASAEETRSISNLRAGMPRDVGALIARRVMCNHWGDEAPYDAARRRYIEAAVNKLRCGKLDADESAIRSKYRGNDKINQRLDIARESFP